MRGKILFRWRAGRPRTQTALARRSVLRLSCLLLVFLVPLASLARPSAAAGDPVFVGAGDIASSGGGAESTARLLDTIDGTVFTLGDNAYGDGSPDQYQRFYDPTWGRHKARTYPAPGNHDYHQPNASGYFGYFGERAGPAGRGYYSFELGAWHLISLDSEIAADSNSAQAQWLQADLAAHPARCILAYWHKPLFSSGSHHGNDPHMRPIWQILAQAGATLVLTGHDHEYERFAPQTASGQADPRGIREFVVGTGGASHYGFAAPQPNSEVRDATTFGVLKLTLHPTSYDWAFVPAAGGSFTDTGSGACVGGSGPGPTTPPTGTAQPQPTVTQTPASTNTAQPLPTTTRSPTSTATPTAEQSPTSTISPTSTQPPSTPSPPGGAVVALAPTADAFVEHDDPDSNFGQVDDLDAGANPLRSSFLCFPSAGRDEVVRRAQLQLTVTNGSTSAALNVFTTAEDWHESDVTWNAQPDVVARLGARAAAPFMVGQIVAIDLDPALIDGDDPLCLDLTSDAQDELRFASREHATPPQLLLAFGEDGETVTPTVLATTTTGPPTTTAVASPTNTPVISPTPTTTASPGPTTTPSPPGGDMDNRWHPPTDHEHGDDCTQPLPGNPFTQLGNPALDVLKAGEPHAGFKQFLLYQRQGDQPVPGTFACIVFHIGPLTSKARSVDRHQLHLLMQDGHGHITDAAWMFQIHGAGPSECDTIACGGRWRDGSHNKDLAMERDVSPSRAYERWWIDTNDGDGVAENSLIDFYTSVRIEDAATYVQENELPANLALLSTTLFDATMPLHFTCAKLNISGFCPFNDSRRSSGSWHIRVKRTGVFFTDMNGQVVAPNTPGAIRQTLYATRRDYDSHSATEYDAHQTVVWPN